VRFVGRQVSFASTTAQVLVPPWVSGLTPVFVGESDCRPEYRTASVAALFPFAQQVAETFVRDGGMRWKSRPPVA
jgi:hypothetical protein